MLFLLKGIILGLSIAAPVGPIGILCIRRTLANGMGIDFISGLGAATADALYGLIAALGISVVSVFLLDHQVYLRLSGGLFLLYLGFATFRSIPVEVSATAHENVKGFLGAYISTVFLTITNPMTILSFAAVFAGLGSDDKAGDYLSSVLLVVGVFSGSTLWWFILSGMVSALRQKFDKKRLRWVNRISGLIISGFGIFSLISIIATK